MKYVAYRDKDGEPLKVLEWGKLFEDMEYRLVAHSVIGNKRVGTFWMGVVDLDGTYFETAIFDESNNILDRIKYSSLPEAVLGHEAEVYRVKTDAI